MSYKNDQFFNFNGSEIEKGYGLPARNNNVEYPKTNRERFIEYKSDGWRQQYTTIKRGYIRTLLETTQTSGVTTRDVPLIKCNFQFNPTNFSQTVAMRSDVRNQYLQDAAQLTQPLAGETTFRFTLMFDRSYTLNNESESYRPDALGTAEEKNIGVLADIRALYEVIGQGFSKDLIEAQQEAALRQAIAEANEEATGGTAPTLPSRNEIYNSNYFDNVNFGNMAFLMPNPVRVVFSSLFMVDGYVTGTDVQYVKFSSTLVPTMCYVSLDMQAMYVGYAKERTFVTANLEEAQKSIADQIAANLENAKNVIATLKENMRKIKLKAYTTIFGKFMYSESWWEQVTRFPTVRDIPFIGEGNVLSRVDIKAIDSYLVTKNKINEAFIERTTPRAITFQYTNDEIEGALDYFDVDVQESANYDSNKLKSHFESGNVAINLDFTLFVYGPFSKAEADNFVYLDNKITKSSDLSVDPTEYATLMNYRKLLVSKTRLESPTINTWDGWEDIRKGNHHKLTASKSILDNKFNNELLERLEKQSRRYFVTRLESTITPTAYDYSEGSLYYHSNAKVVELDGDNSKIEMDLDLTS